MIHDGGSLPGPPQLCDWNLILRSLTEGQRGSRYSQIPLHVTRSRVSPQEKNQLAAILQLSSSDRITQPLLFLNFLVSACRLSLSRPVGWKHGASHSCHSVTDCCVSLCCATQIKSHHSSSIRNVWKIVGWGGALLRWEDVLVTTQSKLKRTMGNFSSQAFSWMKPEWESDVRWGTLSQGKQTYLTFWHLPDTHTHSHKLTRWLRMNKASLLTSGFLFTLEMDHSVGKQSEMKWLSSLPF